MLQIFKANVNLKIKTSIFFDFFSRNRKSFIKNIFNSSTFILASYRKNFSRFPIQLMRTQFKTERNNDCIWKLTKEFFHPFSVLLLVYYWRLDSPLWMDPFNVSHWDGIHWFRPYLFNLGTTWSFQEIHLELFSTRERAPQQLRKLSSCSRHCKKTRRKKSFHKIVTVIFFFSIKSVAPISGSSDETMILKMMDEEDGVTNRRTKKVGKKKDQRLLLNGMAESQDDLDLQ